MVLFARSVRESCSNATARSRSGVRFFAALLCACLLVSVTSPSGAQEVDEDQLGAWYMYFFNVKFDDSQWGVQGDLQYRAWDWGSDMEQLLLRGGLPTLANTVSVRKQGEGDIGSMSIEEFATYFKGLLEE